MGKSAIARAADTADNPRKYSRQGVSSRGNPRLLEFAVTKYQQNNSGQQQRKTARTASNNSGLPVAIFALPIRSEELPYEKHPMSL
jgi:hypothetical protein